MVTQELLSYIQEQKQNGYSLEIIKQTLLQHNWPAQDVEDALNQFTNPALQTTPPKRTHSSVLVILLMIFIYPLGVILMWAWMKHWATWLKLVLSIAVILPILAIILAISLMMLNPAKQLSSTYDIQRKNDITDIYNAIQAYKNDHNGYPLPLEKSVNENIGSGTYDLNLCADLVPAYLSDIPVDPVSGKRSYTSGNCTQAGVSYSSGYALSFDQTTQHMTISSKSTFGQPISITH